MTTRRHRPSPLAASAAIATAVLVTVMAVMVVMAAPAAGRAADDATAPERIAALIAALGDDDYHRRESAAADLKALGPTAIDALLAAAETSRDLEVSLRARWLVESIPFGMPHDPPEVEKLLSRYKRRDFADRVQSMHRLLRLDDDAGIEPLARIVRLEPSTAGSHVAAALLAREWRPDDPDWPPLRRRIAAGLGPGRRPAVRFLQALLDFTGAVDQRGRDAALAAAGEALADLDLTATDDPTRSQAAVADAEQVAADQTRSIFERCHVRLVLAAGRRPDALALAEGIIRRAQAADDEEGTGLAEAVAWVTQTGLPDAAVGATTRPDDRRPLVDLAVAAAERALGRIPAADERFAAALAAVGERPFAERLQAAILLVKWGCTDWATRAYDALVQTADLPAAELAMTVVMYAEFLHDLERDDEAAGCLERLFAAPTGDGQRQRGLILDTFGRDPRANRARMHYFASCARARDGDVGARREEIEKALAASPKDVDALIAFFALPDNTPEQQADARMRIKAALSQIDDEIQAVPEDANGYNEYAWLVANTEGDLDKATRYSRLSLVKSFDNPSYLDTLAHCHAAAGRHGAAIRTQRLALRHEPHNRTIRKNLARFEQLAP